MSRTPKPPPEGLVLVERYKAPASTSPRERSMLKKSPLEFAPPTQVFQTVTSVVEIIRQTVRINMYLKAMFGKDPVRFKQLGALAEDVVKHHFFFNGWCNSLRRYNLSDLGDLWEHRDAVHLQKLTADLLGLMQTTNFALVAALTSLAEGSPTLVERVKLNYRVLRAVYFSLESRRYTGTLKMLFVQRCKESFEFETSQPLLVREPPKMFLYIYTALQSAFLCLEQIDSARWKDTRMRLFTWGIGQFDEPMTLDFLLSQDATFGLRDGILRGLDRMLFSVAEAMRDLQTNDTLNDEQREKLNEQETHIQQVLDMQEVFILSMGLWTSTNLRDYLGEGRMTPAAGINLAFHTLYCLQPAMEQVLNQAWRDKAEAELQSSSANTASVPQATSPPVQQITSGIMLQAEEPGQSDPVVLAEYDQFFALMDQDAGQILTDIDSSSPRSPSSMDFKYGTGDPDDVELYGVEGATELAERPFQRILNRNDLSIGAQWRDELERHTVTFWTSLTQYKRQERTKGLKLQKELMKNLSTVMASATNSMAENAKYLSSKAAQS